MLSQSQGWKTTTLAIRKTRQKGASSNRVRRGRASGLSSETRSSGQKAPVFLIQNQTGSSAPASQPSSKRG